MALSLLTVVGTLVVIPRPTYPQILPLPEIDPAELYAREAEELRRALAAKDGSLDREVRAVGEQVRRIGLTLSQGQNIDELSLRALRKDAQMLRGRPSKDGTQSGVDALLELRALQSQLFLVASHRFATAGELNQEVRELGGRFHHVAAEAWLADGRFTLRDDELRLFFRVHWGKLTGLDDKPPFSPSLEELKRYYSSNLQHPAGHPADVITQATSQIGFARALGRVDNKYPTYLAQGILQLRLGQPELAAHNLRIHLDIHPDGPWTQLARNHLLLAKKSADTSPDTDP